MTAVDGGSLEDVLKAFTVGFVTGVAIHGIGKALSKIKFCFVAGTAVVLANGMTKPIENIRSGDFVRSYNVGTGRVTNKRVLQTFENEIDELITVHTSDGQHITATPGHKFYANYDWISAQDLRAGDILVTVNGQKVVVEKVQHELLEVPVKVYNFEVADNHTYFVGGDNGVVVHNANCRGRTPRADKIKADGDKIFTNWKDLPEGSKYAYEFKLDLGDGRTASYVGKGTNGRVDISLNAKIKEFKGTLVEGSKKLYLCADDTAAFIKEAELMNKYLLKNQLLLNKIASPGFKYSGIPFKDAFRDLMAKHWFKHL